MTRMTHCRAPVVVLLLTFPVLSLADGNSTTGSGPTSTPNATHSWCDDCAQGGNCSSPSGYEAKYCGAWLNETAQVNTSTSCCCNLSWSCRVSATSCDCFNSLNYPESEPPQRMDGITKGLIMIGAIAGACLLAVVALCWCGCRYGCGKRSDKRASRSPRVVVR